MTWTNKTHGKRRKIRDALRASESSLDQMTGSLLSSNRSVLAAINRLQHKDDGWIDKMRAEVDSDEQALNELLDDKERELSVFLLTLRYINRADIQAGQISTPSFTTTYAPYSPMSSADLHPRPRRAHPLKASPISDLPTNTLSFYSPSPTT